MNRIVLAMAAVLVLFGAPGCEQKGQKQKPLSYSPAAAPAMIQIEQLQQTAKMDPKNAGAWINLGNNLMDAQRFSEAIDAYEKSLALEPRNVNVLVDLGTCYRGVGKFDKAIEQYQKALKIDPNFPNGHRNMGVVLSYDLNKPADGIKSFKRYLEVAPNAPDAGAIKQAIQELSARK